MDKGLYFIQFAHPGAEHVLSTRADKRGDTTYEWNYGGHKRKFLETEGQYIDVNDQIQSGLLQFWGEWEPDSEVKKIISSPAYGDFPHYIHKPILTLDKCGKVVTKESIISRSGKILKRQNTDPFVFGETFHYCCCKQGRFKKLTKLTPGSIILFGSTINQNTADAYFALDTVFVVAEGKKYVSNNYESYLKGYISDVYIQITGFDIWKKEANSANFNCYKGVMFPQREKFSGMYSFVPCKLSENGGKGFERVKLYAKDFTSIISNIPNAKDGRIITNNLNSAPKITSIKSMEINKIIWSKIREIIKSQGFLEGVRMEYKTIEKQNKLWRLVLKAIII